MQNWRTTARTHTWNLTLLSFSTFQPNPVSFLRTCKTVHVTEQYLQVNAEFERLLRLRSVGVENEKMRSLNISRHISWFWNTISDWPFDQLDARFWWHVDVYVVRPWMQSISSRVTGIPIHRFFNVIKECNSYWKIFKHYNHNSIYNCFPLSKNSLLLWLVLSQSNFSVLSVNAFMTC